MNCRTKSRAWCSHRVGERTKEGGRGDAVGQRRKERRRMPTERDIKVFRVAKVAAAAATSKRPPTAGLWLRLSARVPGCVCVRSCTRSRLSLVRDRAAEAGWASTELRFRSDRCALLAACVRDSRVRVLRPSLCTRANVRVLYPRAFPPCSRRRLRSLHGKDNVAASFQTPWNDRVAAPPSPRNVSSPFLLPQLFLTPPLVSSFYSSSLRLGRSSKVSRLTQEPRDIQEGERIQPKHNESGRNVLSIINHRVLVDSYATIL